VNAWPRMLKRTRAAEYCDLSVAAFERAYHRQFAAHRLHGEWFAPHPDILAEIDRLKEAENG